MQIQAWRYLTYCGANKYQDVWVCWRNHKRNDHPEKIQELESKTTHQATILNGLNDETTGIKQNHWKSLKNHW